ncbi:MAG: hypothetical protein HS116_08805 [Planctomycetes bacterium]|nr:hypothetical protein [Planctomycetota bacterium]
MRPIARRLAAFLLALSTLACAPLAAQDDYTYAQRLLESHAEDLDAPSLVRRLAARLESARDPRRALTARLLRALACRTDARRATPARRQELLAEAEAHYQAFLAGGANHPDLARARADTESLQLDFARAQAQAAAADPARAGELGMQAAQRLLDLAQTHRIAAERLRVPLKAAFADPDLESEDDAKRARVLQRIQAALEPYLEHERPHLTLRLEALAAMPACPERAAAARALIAHLQAHLDSEDLGLLDDLCAWFQYAKGRTHALLQDEDAAAAAWREALGYEMGGAPAEARAAAHEIRMAILRDYVAMHERSASPERFEKIVEIVTGSLDHVCNPYMQHECCKPGGKLLRIARARAWPHVPDAGAEEFERALRDLHAIVRDGPPWSRNAAQAMAEIAALAAQRRVRPNLAPAVWLGAAHGAWLDGHAAAQRARELGPAETPEARTVRATERESFERAVALYRKAISAARGGPHAGPAERLFAEPRAWSEMSDAHLRLDEPLEAYIAAQALRDFFAPGRRDRWLPDPKRDPKFHAQPGIAAALAALDTPAGNEPGKEGWLARADNAANVALGRLQRTDPHLYLRLQEGQAQPNAYARSAILLDDARRLHEAARAAESLDAALARARDAFLKAEAAALGFQSLAAGDPQREAALYQTGAAWALAAQLAADAPLKHAPEAQRERACAAQALANWEAYESHLRAHAAQDDRALARRAERARAIALQRLLLHHQGRDWDRVLEAAAAYTALAPAADPNAALVALRCVQAYSAGTEGFPAPEAAQRLGAAEALLDKLAAQPAHLSYARRTLAARYVALAGDSAAEPEELRAWHGRAADLFAADLAAQEAPPLETAARLLPLLHAAGRPREAAAHAQRLLALHDPRDRNGSIEDEAWPALLEAMQSVLRFDDRERWKRCRQDHAVLIDWLYETRAGAANGDVPSLRPAHDKHPVDYERALEQLAGIRRNYPDAATVAPQRDEERFRGVSWLDAVAAEIARRRTLLSVRESLVDLALEAAQEEEAAGRTDEAARLRQTAADQLGLLLEALGDIPSLRLRRAEALAAGGAVREAIGMLEALRAEWPDRDSAWYVRLARRISELHFERRDFAAAAEWPERMRIAGVNAEWKRKHWPDVDAFLERCYAAGAPRPGEPAPAAPAALPAERSPDEKELDRLRKIERAGTEHPEVLTEEFRWRLAFVARKVAHRQAFAELERTVLEARAQGRESELPEAARRKHRLATDLVAAEDAAWRTEQRYRAQIARSGGEPQVPEAIRAERQAAWRRADALAAEWDRTE